MLTVKAKQSDFKTAYTAIQKALASAQKLEGQFARIKSTMNADTDNDIKQLKLQKLPSDVLEKKINELQLGVSWIFGQLPNPKNLTPGIVKAQNYIYGMDNSLNSLDSQVRKLLDGEISFIRVAGPMCPPGPFTSASYSSADGSGGGFSASLKKKKDSKPKKQNSKLKSNETKIKDKKKDDGAVIKGKKVVSETSKSRVTFTTVIKGTVGVNPNAVEVFTKQAPGSRNCTQVAVVNMMRRKAILNGDPNWASITEGNTKSVLWTTLGLPSSATYSTAKDVSYTYTKVSSLPADKKEYFISMLQSHPEGIVIYNSGHPHAVLLTSYDRETNTFYCADPYSKAGQGVIKLTDAIGGIDGRDQEDKINKISAIWYLK